LGDIFYMLKGLFPIFFTELFMVHRLEENATFYHLPKPRYMQNKGVFQITGVPERMGSSVFC